jgi:hypothetical protein
MGDDLLRFETSLCAFNACSWNEFGRRIGCGGGTGDCIGITFLRADSSNFHPPELQIATERIIEALKDVKAPEGMKLAILVTPFGNVLAFVEPDAKFPERETRNAHSSPEEIIKALGLKGVSPDDCQAA